MYRVITIISCLLSTILKNKLLDSLLAFKINCSYLQSVKITRTCYLKKLQHPLKQ